MKRIINTRITG